MTLPTSGACVWRCCWSPSVLLLGALLLVGCGVHAPPRSLLLNMRQGPSHSGDTLGEEPGRGLSSQGAAQESGASGRKHGREQDARERARRLEEARIQEWLQAARQEERGAEAEEAAREAELERTLARVSGVASRVEESGAKLSFTFWAEEGALTLLSYRQEGGTGRVGGRVHGAELAQVLRLIFSAYVGRRTGEVVLTLRREETRWAVDYAATHNVRRPPEARTLPVRSLGTPADTFLCLYEASGQWRRAVQVVPGSETRVEFVVHLEDGRLTGWELLTLQRTQEARGGSLRPLPSEMTGAVTHVLLPFTEGLGPRTVHLMLRARHGPGEADMHGWVESARVVRLEPPSTEPSWYRAMHEATLLRWREGVQEGSAWLARKGVEEMALWYAGRSLMERIEQLVAIPLSPDDKKSIREAARRYYKKLHPELEALMDEFPMRYPVHHRRPVEYAHLFPDEDINAAENLMLAQKPVHERINALWSKFRAAREGATAREVEEVAAIIDDHLGSWCDRVNLPEQLPPAFTKAEEAALRELQHRFAGLK